MRNRVPDEATCAICGRHFDPSETRGWCPNPSCGEWQHPSFPIDDESAAEGDSGVADEGSAGGDEDVASPTTPTKSCPNCGNDVRANANFCKHCATQLTGDNQPRSEAETETEESVVDECPDCGADLSGIPQDRLSTCPICMFDLTPVIEEGEESDHGGASGGADETPKTQALTECPNCGEDLTAIPEEMRTVCPGCRVDLDEGLETDTDPGTHQPTGQSQRQPPAGGEQQSPTGQNRRQQPGTAHDSGGATPGSTTPLEAMEHIAGGYVQRLSDIGVTTVEDLVNADPDTVSAKTGISARRIRGWVDDAPVDAGAGDDAPINGGPGDGGSQSPGTASDPQSVDTEPDELDDQETRIQRSPDTLVLTVMGEEIEVTDGMTVGKAVRKAMVDAGAPEEDAVYVHRKHIRVDADENGFFLARLGENSLTVNGQTVEKGEEARLEDGDEIGFSGVVTATVSIR